MIDQAKRDEWKQLAIGSARFGGMLPIAVLDLLTEVGLLEAERTTDAQAFVSPAARIANLEHELADLRESETTQATRIASLEFRLKVADAEIDSLRGRIEVWVDAVMRSAR